MKFKEFEEASGIRGIERLMCQVPDTVTADWWTWSDKRGCGEYIASWSFKSMNGYVKFKLEVDNMGDVSYHIANVLPHCSMPWKVQLSRMNEEMTVSYGSMDASNEFAPAPNIYWSMPAGGLSVKRKYNHETLEYDVNQVLDLTGECQTPSFQVGVSVASKAAWELKGNFDASKELPFPDAEEEFTRKNVQATRDQAILNLLKTLDKTLQTADSSLLHFLRTACYK